MPSGLRSKLNSTIYCGIREAITRKQGVPRLFYRDSALSLSLRHSASFLSDITYCPSSLTLKRKSMAASTSKAVFGDVYLDDIITSCSSALDFTKPTGVYFKERSRKGCLRVAVNFRRPELLNGPLSFGYSPFDASWRNQNLSLLHGPRLKNFSISSSACFSARAAHDVSFDGSTSDQQLETISPDQYAVHHFK